MAISIGPRKRFALCLLWPFLALAVIAALSPLWFPQLGYLLVVSDPLKKSDAIVSLGGGDTQRCVISAKLYEQKWAPKVITTGDVTPDYAEAMGRELTFAKLGARLIADNGVPEDDVIVLNAGTSTYEEALALKEYCSSHDFKRLIIVTTIYHTRRARGVFRNVFEDSGVEIIVRPAEGGKFTTEDWWKREDDLIFVNNEWMKLALYFLQGKI